MATFYGTPGQDTINGTNLDDIIYGYPLGGDPNVDESDTLSGGGGNDSIDGGGGFGDLISGDDGDDTLLSGGGFFDTLDGGKGNDVLDSQGIGFHTLIDGPASASGDDTLIGGDRVITHGGADRIVGAMTWEARYEDSADALLLSSGATPGDYTLTGGTSATAVSNIEFHAGTGNDTITTGGGNDLVVDAPAGVASDDLISTGAGDDTLTTNGGADTVDAGADTDVWFGHFEGEAGDLTTVWDDAAQQLSVSNGTTVRNFEYMTFYAGSGDDLLAGAAYDDVIYDAPVGVGSNDTVNAGTGNDVVVTYGGIDVIDGGEPPVGAGYSDTDRWEGHYESASADLVLTWQAALAGWSLSDGTVATNIEAVTFFSGSGNDTLDGASETDVIDGGAGDDLIDTRGVVDADPQQPQYDELYGGIGNDTLISGDGTDLLVDGIAGDEGNDLMRGGAGSDTFVSFGGIDTIDGGDGEDPQANMSIDMLEAHFETSGEAIALDLSASDSATLANGFEFSGIEALRLFAGSGDDVITVGKGLGDGEFQAANEVDGGAGNDHIRSWDGFFTGFDDTEADTLAGGIGNDTLEGAFTMYGGDDADLLLAGDGASYFDDESTGGSYLSGDGGSDTLVGGLYTDHLVGGGGDDVLNAVSSQIFSVGNFYYEVLDGGEGKDTINGGDGADFIFDTASDDSVDILKGGAATDEYQFRRWFSGAAADVITDFVAGAGGDSLAVVGLLDLATGRDWYEAPYDPWAEGYLQLKQDGSDTLLQVDQDGAAGGQDWETVVILQDTIATDVTFENFESWPDDSLDDFYAQKYQPAYAPDDAAPPIVGGNGDDVLGGTKLADVMNGAAGDDTLRGGGGNDSVCGGTGDDVLKGAAGDDSLLGARGDDRLRGGGGADSIDGGRGDDTIYGDGGNDTIAGGAGDDRLRGGGGLDTIKLSAGFGDDVLLDYGDGDTLIFDAPLVGGAGGQADSVAELRALVEAAPNVTAQISGNSVVLEFSSGDSLTLRNVADEWAVA